MLPFGERHVIREYAGGSVGGAGILRKTGGGANGAPLNSGGASTAGGGYGGNSTDARPLDLLVFGYACKVFRDDEKARDIDQGKHLIPWMGDNSLKIDRYDVRGALYDLAPHEAPAGGYGNRLDYLSTDEQRAEQLCEEERYLFLYNNEEELVLQQEEDLKRLRQAANSVGYSEVGFQYGNEASSGLQHGPSREDSTDSPTCEEAEQPFCLPANFEVPTSMQLPETMKQHAIVEKTARFIASQGVQMEILLKAKQSNNVQFEFLNQNSSLNAYYKYVMNAIKDGTYPAQQEPLKEDPVPVEDSAEQDEPSVVERPVITVPTIKYKPSVNCAYTQLISKIKGVPLPEVIDEASRNSGTSSPSAAGNGGRFTPVLLQYNGNTFVTADDEDTNSTSTSGQMQTPGEQPQVELLQNSSALALAQGYTSGSDSEAEEEEAATKPSEPAKPEPVLNFPVPVDNLKNIIDKTATYVIKNGRQFEETLRSKSEERFTFLLPDNEFYPYYMYKITNDPDAASKEQKTRKAAAVAAALLSKRGIIPDKSLVPVSFSIKPKEDNTAAVLLPVLPQENSDEDEEVASARQSQTRVVPEEVRRAIQLVESQLMAKNVQMVGPTLMSPAIHRGRFDMDFNPSLNTKGAHGSKTSKAEMERNALFEQQQQNRQKELKKAEEKVKDKLAQIAREKLGGLLTKEKQLQLERKRKAMAFLNQIKGTPPAAPVAGEGAVVAPAKTKKKTGNEDEEGSDSADSTASVHSIPITSFGPDGRSDDELETELNKLPAAASKARATPTTTAEKKTKDELPAKTEGAETTEAETAAKLKPSPKPETVVAMTSVLLSDDDDVELISETPPTKEVVRSLRKRRSRSREVASHVRHKRHRKLSSPDTSSSSKEDRETGEEGNGDLNGRRSTSRHYRTSKSKKSSKSSKHKTSKKKSKKKRSRSHSSSHSRGYSQIRHHRHREGEGSKSHRRHSVTSSSGESSSESSGEDRSYHRRSRSSHKPTSRKEHKTRDRHQH